MQTGNSFMGIEIGGTKLQLIKGQSPKTILKKIRYTINSKDGAAGIQEQLSAGLKEMGIDDVAAIGVGFGGPVDWINGIILVSHQIEGWNNFHFTQWLQELTGKPVVIENDANTAALAEALHGSGKGYERVFYMTIGSGIGGGFILNGEIYHGRTPGEVEIGHLRLNKNGETLEEKCSGWAVNKKTRASIEQQPEGILSQLSVHHQGPEAMLLPLAIEKGDAAAKQILDQVADDLAFALSHVVHIFHPDILIIGGGLSLLKEQLLRPVQERLHQYIMQAFLPLPLVTVASLEEEVVPLGAMELARRISRVK